MRYSYTLLTADTSHTTPTAQKGSTGLFRPSHITMLALEVAGKGVETETREQLTENKCMPCPFARHRCFSPELECPLGVERTAVLYGVAHSSIDRSCHKSCSNLSCQYSLLPAQFFRLRRTETLTSVFILFATYLRIL